VGIVVGNSSCVEVHPKVVTIGQAAFATVVKDASLPFGRGAEVSPIVLSLRIVIVSLASRVGVRKTGGLQHFVAESRWRILSLSLNIVGITY